MVVQKKMFGEILIPYKLQREMEITLFENIASQKLTTIKAIISRLMTIK